MVEPREIWADASSSSSEEDLLDLPPNLPLQAEEPTTPTSLYDPKQIPTHHCSYCGNHDPSTVVRCISDNCGRWFCNSYGTGKAGSHIIQHLVKAGHKQVVLHPDNKLGDEFNMECFVCQSKNVFVLGLVASKSESNLIFVCREPCRTLVSPKEWDVASWQPLIEEKRFLSWIVSIPSPSEDAQAWKITIRDIAQLEDLIKRDQHASMEQLQVVDTGEGVKSVQLRYRDAASYKRVFEQLIMLEADYDRLMKQSQKQTNIKIHWELVDKKYHAKFLFPKQDNEIRLVPGDEMRITIGPDNPWSVTGIIIRIIDEEEVELEITKKTDDSNQASNTISYTVEFVWKPTTYKRMMSGLSMFVDRRHIDPDIMQKILGNNIENVPFHTHLPKVVSPPNLPELNHSQVQAVTKALQSKMALIQGPPGTGKTVTSASIVFHMVKDSKVMVCAPSNIAVDQLAEKIHCTGVKVVRLCAKSREAISSSVDFLTLHQQVRRLEGTEYQKLHHWFELKDTGVRLSAEDEREFRNLKRRGEEYLLHNAEVVCCTCAGSFDARVRRFNFQKVLIDEATQATEVECLLPMLMGRNQVILVGDHCQLGPVVMCKKAVNAGYNKSLYERLVILGIRPIRLHVQYRMHPAISEFPSITFYDGMLQNGVSLNERVYRGIEFPWPVPTRPILFYNSIGQEELSGSGTSYLNRTEAANVEKIVTTFLRAGLNPCQLGIITPYEGQRAYITNFMLKSGTLGPNEYKGIEISSVDSFQGREKDFIILSCVRSNENLGIGFLSDSRRLNVALTRARYGLVICGNARVLSKQPLWSNLLNHYKDNGVLVEGPLNNLKQCMLQLPAPAKLQITTANYPDQHTVADRHPFLRLGMFAAMPDLQQDVLASL